VNVTVVAIPASVWVFGSGPLDQSLNGDERPDPVVRSQGWNGKKTTENGHSSECSLLPRPESGHETLRSHNLYPSSIKAQRLKRVFNIEICPECVGPVKVIDCIEDPAVIEKILIHLQRKATSDPIAVLTASRAPPADLFV